MKFSIIIPTYNEEKTLQKVVFQTEKVWSGSDYEIIVVDDGSKDKTFEISEKLKNENISVIHHDKNYGKGKAVISGIKKASGDFVTIQDADLEYSPKTLWQLCQEAKSDEVIYGKRDRKKGYLPNRLGNKILSSLCNFLFGSNLFDIYTCYKIIPRPVLNSLHLKSDGFEIEAEITAKLLKRKIRIKEIQIPYFPRGFSEGKKIRWTDGLKGIWTLIKIKLSIPQMVPIWGSGD
jgi:glycosyltransferase involved in cell wall biosynthesis